MGGWGCALWPGYALCGRLDAVYWPGVGVHFAVCGGLGKPGAWRLLAGDVCPGVRGAFSVDWSGLGQRIVRAWLDAQIWARHLNGQRRRADSGGAVLSFWASVSVLDLGSAGHASLVSIKPTGVVLPVMVLCARRIHPFQ